MLTNQGGSGSDGKQPADDGAVGALHLYGPTDIFRYLRGRDQYGRLCRIVHGHRRLRRQGIVQAKVRWDLFTALPIRHLS